MEPVERRLAILNAAKHVFAEKGYFSAGVADIIAEAGIARGTFYLYFQSKREVFSALIEHLIQTVTARMVAIPVEEKHGIYPGFLTNLEHLKNAFLEDPDLGRILFREATAVDSESNERMQELHARIAERLAGMLSHWQKQGRILDVDPLITAYAFIGGVREIVEQFMYNNQKIMRDPEEVIRTVLHMYLFGVINPAHNAEVVEHMGAVEEAVHRA